MPVNCIPRKKNSNPKIKEPLKILSFHLSDGKKIDIEKQKTKLSNGVWHQNYDNIVKAVEQNNPKLIKSEDMKQVFSYTNDFRRKYTTKATWTPEKDEKMGPTVSTKMTGLFQPPTTSFETKMEQNSLQKRTLPPPPTPEKQKDKSSLFSMWKQKIEDNKKEHNPPIVKMPVKGTGLFKRPVKGGGIEEKN